MPPSTLPTQSSNSRFLLTAAAFVIVVAGMRAAEPILVPLLIAGFLAIISTSPVFWLRKKNIPASAAVFLVILGVLVLGFGFILLIGTSLEDFSKAIPRYQSRLTQEMGPLLLWIESLGFQLNEELLLKSLDPGASMRLVGRMLSGLGGILTNSFLIMLTVIFILLEASSFQHKVRAAFGDPKGTLSQFSKITDAVNHYLALKTLVSLGTGIIVASWVAILDIDFPVIWGLLAFLLNFIPNLGSIIAAVPPILLGFIQFGLGRALLVALGYGVVNVLFGNVVEPKLMGRKLGLSTLVVFLSLVFWGWVWGPVGMLLSVPMTMVVKIALESSPSTHWLSIMLDSEASVANVAKQQEDPSTG
ncbi:MAG: AI-2E family transporter [Nitrospirota bacterium]|nr:AI-2E family transporter [Nitrospirota bacterium]MDH5585717.1 AI-2E family transporter [Nitrospirota bacterium]